MSTAPPEAASARVTTKLSASEAKSYNATWWRNGSYRYADLEGQNGTTFDATTLEFQNISTFEDTTYVTAGRGQSPITAMQTFTLYDRGLAQWVAANSQDDRVTTETVDGRETLKAEIDIPADELGIGSPNRAELSVDKETLIVLSEKLYNTEGVVSETTLTDFEVQASAPAFTRLNVPSDSDISPVASNFKVTDSNGGSTLEGVDAPRLVQVPDDFELGSVAVELTDGAVSGPEGLNPPSQAHAVWTYQAGWKQFFFSARLSDAPASQWVNPFASEGKALQTQTAALSAGLFSGARAEFSNSAYIPHAWAAQGQFEVDLSGPLDREQFEEILNDLE